MKYEAIEWPNISIEPVKKPRRLIRFWNIIRDGLPSAGRYKRYLAVILPALLAIWIATAAYLIIAPENYESKFTLILPGSGAGGSLNMESIGQAQSSVNSAFSSATLSPTENYKRLLMADVTLRRAALSIDEDARSFPAPSIKLIDQTNLIELSIDARSPEQAKKRADALRNAFSEQLDKLRRDEAIKREESDTKHLKLLEKKVQNAQRKLIDFQAKNGLVSLDQFNNRIARIDDLREKEREARTLLRGQSAMRSRYSRILGTGAKGANTALRLKSDPVFQGLLNRYAALHSDAEQKSATLGEAHAEMAQADGERNQLRAALAKRGRSLTGLNEAKLMNKVDLSISDGRSNLFENMINTAAHKAGASASLAEIRRDLARQQGRAGKLVKHASVLADLTRDHRVAEAVFSTALARLDTNKQDPFASYPLVQTLEEPSLPKGPSSPSAIIAIGGALLATILLLIGFGILWLRQIVIHKILLKN